MAMKMCFDFSLHDDLEGRARGWGERGAEVVRWDLIFFVFHGNAEIYGSLSSTDFPHWTSPPLVLIWIDMAIIAALPSAAGPPRLTVGAVLFNDLNNVIFRRRRSGCTPGLVHNLRLTSDFSSGRTPVTGDFDDFAARPAGGGAAR